MSEVEMIVYVAGLAFLGGILVLVLVFLFGLCTDWIAKRFSPYKHTVNMVQAATDSIKKIEARLERLEGK